MVINHLLNGMILQVGKHRVAFFLATVAVPRGKKDDGMKQQRLFSRVD